jgi:hypothetical protein
MGVGVWNPAPFISAVDAIKTVRKSKDGVKGKSTRKKEVTNHILSSTLLEVKGRCKLNGKKEREKRHKKLSLECPKNPSEGEAMVFNSKEQKAYVLGILPFDRGGVRGSSRCKKLLQGARVSAKQSPALI